MFLLARRFMQRRDATFAAALVRRQSVSHRDRLLAKRLCRVAGQRASAAALAGPPAPRKRQIGTQFSHLGLIVAAAWLTNVPAAVMLTYSLALLLVVAAIMRRSLRPLAIGAIAVLLGLALAAFYVVPVLYEQKWVEIAQVLSLGRPSAGQFHLHFAQQPGSRSLQLADLAALGRRDDPHGRFLVSLTRPGAPALPSSGPCLRPGRRPPHFCSPPSAFCSIAFSRKCVTCNFPCAGCSV